MATWLITGASSSLGAALARAVLDRGDSVAVTARQVDQVQQLVDRYPDRTLPLPLDVTNQDQAVATVAAVTERFGALDVLVNNAGYGYTAAVEEGEDEAVARLFATNFFGPVAMIKAALPAMRRRGAGLIVNISSVGARITIPGGGYYSAAKAALEAGSGSLRNEVEPWGIRVVVEPGSLRTDFRGRSAGRSSVQIDAYDQVLGRSGNSTLGPQRGAPDKAAAAIVHAVQAPEPPNLLVLGSDALDGFRSAADDAARDVNRFERLSRSTDASP